MEDLRNFASALAQVAEERGIPYEKVVEIIEMAIAAAYKKDYGEKGQIIKAKLDSKTGKIKFWQVKLVLDESMIYSEEELERLKSQKASPIRKNGLSGGIKKEEGEKKGEEEKPKKIRFNPEAHIMFDGAKKDYPKIKAGEEIEFPLATREDYGRIAAQTAKQVILQRIRETEREIILDEYKSKEGEIISGIVQRIEPRGVYLDIGKTLGVLPKEEQVQGEFYRPGQRLKVYILRAESGPKGPMVFLSRIYPKLISKLFELEVPEIANGSVEIKAIAREAGSRSKIAVVSKAEGVDPIGAMVGQRGTRVSAVISELGGEKIDIIEWSDDPEKFVGNAISPAKAVEIKTMPRNKALVVVPEDQLSLAIGKDGQNVRLAAKLTGWRIDVRAPGVEAEDENKDEAEKTAGEETEEVKPKQTKKVCSGLCPDDPSEISPKAPNREKTKKSKKEK